MAEGKQVLTVLVIYVFVASTERLADAASSDGFMFDLLLAHLNEFELRIHQQVELVQQNILRNRQDIEQLAKLIAAEEELATQSDAEISDKLVQIESTSQTVAMNVSDRLYAVQRSVLSLQSQLEHFGDHPLENNKADVEPSSPIPFPVTRHFINDSMFHGVWLVVQSRFSGEVNFNRGWADYKAGFGVLSGEHWLGLEKLHWLVSNGRHELLVALEDFSGATVVAHYDDFVIGDEDDDYRLESLGRYFGTAGDSLRSHVGSRFSTFDNDNDASVKNCGQMFEGGWWFDNCYQSFLNGVYLQGQQQQRKVGIEWYTFRGFYRSMRKCSMMIRPVT